MHQVRPSLLLAGALSIVLMAATLQAQEPASLYVSGGVFADLKRFSGDPDDDRLSGETIGGSAAFGVQLADRFELSLSVDVPRTTDAVETRSVVLRTVRVDVQSITSNRPITVAALLRFEPRPTGLRLGYVAGLSIVALHQRFETVVPPDVPASFVPAPSTTIEYISAPTVGIDARLPLRADLAIVPALHATVVSGREESALLLRPGVSVRWAF